MIRDRKLMVQALKSLNSQVCWTETLKLICDAADTLAHADYIISKKNYPLAKESGWISVKERMPNQEELDAASRWEFLCLCIVPASTGGDYIREARVISYDIFDKRWACSNVIVTHWMNIPKFPAD